MKNAIYVVNHREQMRPNARASMVAAAARWGCRFAEITESANTLHPACWKADALEWAAGEGVERVFILDADLVVSAACPDPFAMFGPEGLQVVSDRQTVCPARDKAETDEWEIVAGQRFKPPFYFNSGVILADVAEHRSLFSHVAQTCREFPHLCWHDQTPFNVVAHHHHPESVAQMSDTWNFHNPARRLAGWADMRATGKFIYHFPGNPDRNLEIDQVRWE
jgi:hypothetical protein